MLETLGRPKCEGTAWEIRDEDRSPECRASRRNGGQEIDVR